MAVAGVTFWRRAKKGMRGGRPSLNLQPMRGYDDDDDEDEGEGGEDEDYQAKKL